MTPSWTKKALCLNMDTNMFFEKYEENPDVSLAVDIMCNRCPVQRKCFSYGITNKEIGVWGGVYLENGEISKDFNLHKEEDDWATLWTCLTTDSKI